MKIKWLVTYVTPVKSPDRAGHAILGLILTRRFLVNSGHFSDREKIEWLLIDATAVGYDGGATL